MSDNIWTCPYCGAPTGSPTSGDDKCNYCQAEFETETEDAPSAPKRKRKKAKTKKIVHVHHHVIETVAERREREANEEHESLQRYHDEKFAAENKSLLEAYNPAPYSVSDLDLSSHRLPGQRRPWLTALVLLSLAAGALYYFVFRS